MKIGFTFIERGENGAIENVKLNHWNPLWNAAPPLKVPSMLACHEPSSG